MHSNSNAIKGQDQPSNNVESHDPNMTQINNPDDVAEFAGQLVAFKTESQALNQPESSYKINGCSFAIISDQTSQWSTTTGDAETSYNMSILLENSENLIPCNHALIQQNIGGLEIRLANEEEKQAIRDAWENERATFEYEANFTTEELESVLGFSDDNLGPDTPRGPDQNYDTPPGDGEEPETRVRADSVDSDGRLAAFEYLQER